MYLSTFKRLYETITTTQLVFDKLGLNNPKLIGRGAEGEVYDIGKLAIKIQVIEDWRSSDESVQDRYRFYSWLKNKRFKYIANIHSVGRLDKIYYVVMDKVDALDSIEQMALEDVIEYHWYTFQNKNSYSFTDPIHLFSGAVKVPDMDVERVKSEFKSKIEQSSDKTALRLLNDIFDICDELKKHKIKWADPNPRNFGKKNGHLVAIDLDDDFETVNKTQKRKDI